MVRGVAKAERARAGARRCWSWCSSAASAARRPAQLSGGQRQRVALARALVNRARGCCCSTSRSARSTSSCASRCRSELKALQRQLGITFVFVTHDQGEALSMADRVAVFNAGPDRAGRHARGDLRAARAPRFVADFVGSSNVAAAAIVAAPVRRAAQPGEPAAGEDRASARRQARRRRSRVDGHRRRGPVSRRQHAARASPLDGGAGAGRRPRRRPRSRARHAASRRAACAGTACIRWMRAHDGAAPVHRASPAAGGLLRRLSDLLCRGPALLLAAAAGAAAAVARRRLSRLAAGAAGAELLLDRRVLRPDRLRVHARRPMPSC